MSSNPRNLIGNPFRDFADVDEATNTLVQEIGSIRDSLRKEAENLRLARKSLSEWQVVADRALTEGEEDDFEFALDGYQTAEQEVELAPSEITSLQAQLWQKLLVLERLAPTAARDVARQLIPAEALNLKPLHKARIKSALDIQRSDQKKRTLHSLAKFMAEQDFKTSDGKMYHEKSGKDQSGVAIKRSLQRSTQKLRTMDVLEGLKGLEFYEAAFGVLEAAGALNA